MSASSIQILVSNSIFQSNEPTFILEIDDGMVTHLEPDILECEVKWALGSITTNKTIGSDGIPVELFKNPQK